MKTTLKDVCTHVVDCKNRTAPIDPDGDFFAVGTPAMRGNVINFAEARRINAETFAEWTQRLTPSPGDILFAREAPVGPVVVIPEGGNIAAGQRTMLLRADPVKANGTFLRFYLSAPETQARILGLAHGSTTPHLRVADVRSFEIDLPSVKEQQAIAEILGALDDKIAANTKLAETADALASTVLLRALDTTSTVRLSAIAMLTMGSSPVGTTLNESGGGTVFYQGVRDFGVRFPSNRIWTTSPDRMAKHGDALISVRAPVGRVNLANEDLCIGRGLAAAHSSDERPFTLFHLLKTSSQIWEPFEAEGTVFGSINKKQLEEIRLPLIHPGQTANLESALQSLEFRIANALHENDTLAATRNALLPQLISGKLRVKDAESIVFTTV